MSRSASTMSTSEPSGLAAPGADVDRAHPDQASFGRELERLTNQFFSAFPGSIAGAGAGAPLSASVPLRAGVAQPPGAPPAIDAGLSAPVAATPNVAPALGPSALALGAGGASPLVTLPPIPGALKQPPLASAPAPKEADLRTAPAMFAENLASTPLALATHPEPGSSPLSGSPGSAGTPYFLELAGP